MSAPLYNKLIKYSKKINSFHMPGHKFGKILNMKDIPFFDLDATEVPGLDNLYESNDVILEAQKKMAKKYGAKESIFLTNGSTSGIVASILTVCSPGDSLIVARNCHHSVWSALILGGIQPIYINPGYDQRYNVLGGICPNELEQVLINNPKVKGVIIVSPTYEGLVSDVATIASVVHAYNKIIIVDEAHGAHFVWDKTFPNSAVVYGVDIVIQSMHKTLPTITQSALIHIGSLRIDKDTLINRLKMIQTSSPSYVMMGIMDYARSEMENQTGLWTNYVQELLNTREKLSKMKNLVLLQKDISGTANIFDMDVSKIVIYTYNTNITGIELSKRLRSKYNIQVELEAEDFIIAMSTVADTAYDLQLLCAGLLEVDGKLIKNKEEIRYSKISNTNDNGDIIPREIYFGKQEDIHLEKSAGRISATNIMLYPPGIPLICIGELFSEEIISNIKMLSAKVLGIKIKHNQIKVIVSKEGEFHGR